MSYCTIKYYEIWNYSEDEIYNDNHELISTHPMVTLNVHLVSRSFFRRLMDGIKYIFGHKSRFGEFDEFLFNPEDIDKLQTVVDYLKKCK